MRVLVTGADGFVGRNSSTYLKRRGFDVVRTDISPSQVVGDISDGDFVFNELGDLDFDAVVHLAAVSNVQRSIEDPYRCFKVNCFGTLNILELSKRKDVRRFIYASSANVYGLPRELPVRETTPLNPRSPYDHSKVIGESLVESYHTNTGLPICILRSWKLFGEHDLPTTAISRFIEACLHDEPTTLYNAGRDTTDPYHVENYCHAVELCLTREEAVGEAFNAGSGRELSIREIAETIKEMMGSRSEFRIMPPRTELEAEPMRSYPSIDKIKDKLGYEPQVDLEEGLKRTIDWVKRSGEEE